MSRISFAVGDFVRLGLTGGRFRVWRVAGVYLGGVYQESVVGLESLDLKPSVECEEMLVPHDLLVSWVNLSEEAERGEPEAGIEVDEFEELSSRTDDANDPENWSDLVLRGQMTSKAAANYANQARTAKEAAGREGVLESGPNKRRPVCDIKIFFE